MSNTGWFDSSFSFAKQALNQAQKSIDRVLDIKEKQGGSEQDEKPVASGRLAWLKVFKQHSLFQ